MHSVEISWFFCHSDFTWNQFWWIWKYEKCLFSIFRGFEFLILVNCSLHRMQKFIEIRIQSLQMCWKWQFLTSKILEFDFTENSSCRKILKFPYCGVECYREHNFPATLILREIDFGVFPNVKKLQFQQFC